MLLALSGAVSQGILWGIMVLGVFITYKMLDIADLTVDGSFALGGCVAAVCSVGMGLDPLVAVLLGMLAGVVAGAVTGLLHTLFDIPAILAGILTQIALWSINLRVMGKSNTPLLNADTVFTRVASLLHVTQGMAALVVGIVVAVLAIVLLYWFFGTEIGSALRATGQNEDMCRASTCASPSSSPSCSPTASWACPVRSSARARSTRTSAWGRVPSSSAWPPSSSARCLAA